jgi:AraC-like DNA-binding protein
MAVSRAFYDGRLRPRSPAAHIDARFQMLSLDRVTVGDMQFGADVDMSFGDLGAYHVDLLMSGSLHWHQGRSSSQLSTAGTAAVFHPLGQTTLDLWTADCRLLAVKIDRRGLEGSLMGLLDRPIRSPLVFGPDLDITQGPGRSFARLAHLFASLSTDPDSWLYRPIIAAPLQEALIAALLTGADHQYRQELSEPARHLSPRAVKRTVDAIQARPEHPFTVAELATIGGTSVRRLQDCYQRNLGLSPLAYLRQVRLRRVHDELCQADPGRTHVADVAHRWGFAHLGRFAATYRMMYGVPPSQTLRNA